MRRPIEPPFLVKWTPARYPLGYLRRRLSEEQVVDIILQYLTVRRAFAVKIDAGAKELRGRIRGALARAGRADEIARVMAGRAGAAKAGVSDITGIWQGRPLWIEVKAPQHTDAAGRVIESAGVPSAEQIDFLLTARLHGAIVGVAWSVEDVAEILDKGGIPA